MDRPVSRHLCWLMGRGRINSAFVFWLMMLLGLAPTRPAAAERLTICHGYSCYYETRLDFGAQDLSRIASIMRAGSSSPEAERRALSRAIQYFERRASGVLGVRDRPKGELGHGRELGQMDCIDESTNTTTLLRLIEAKGMLRHHRVLRRTSRGYLLDNRFPHFAAVIVDKSGRRWAVDSWYEPGGGAPDIMPLDQWKQRGVAGKR
ncbi:hypothetical protein RB623_28005 [Mesorhizobium sp. LHD-90]|uniref:hypothetical protein n=1 Tax=Mesorhizobium sp. LHD-90 TaxID=3071414 RepID=UPI0027DF5AC2|nr:hypothetical protein [Mesorhizobium sp. LHD-90]MDQ6437915.1 hypothetical protein [Mesorhizobium sp. LHD-90]